MSFEWADYLAVAQELAGQPMPNPPSREAKLRSANSRAYYAAFWVALIHLRDYDGDANLDNPHLASVHAYVRDQYRYATANRIRRQIGEDLTRLLASRRTADYNDRQLNLARLARDTESNLELAAQVIRAVQALQANRPGR
jgi:uncharacterized protein (UPF0332 family)